MKVDYKGENYKLPDFLVVGGAKCGTTSLFYYLEQHPEIFAPSEKEPHFFSFVNNPPNFTSPADLRTISDLSDYSKMFDEAQENQLICEASTSYLYDYKNTIKNIKEIYGEEASKELKIIILLRNPIDRAWSQFWQFKKFNHEPLEFGQTIPSDVVEKRLNDGWNYYYDYLGFGRYYEQVKAYMEHFNDVKVFFQETFLEDSQNVLDQTVEFLGVDANYQIETDRKFNPSGKTKNNVFGIIWKLKTQTNLLNFLKQFFPLKIRKKIIYFFMDKALEKQQMKRADKAKVVLEFEEDNRKLYNLLKAEEIKTWSDV